MPDVREYEHIVETRHHRHLAGYIAFFLVQTPSFSRSSTVIPPGDVIEFLRYR